MSTEQEERALILLLNKLQLEKLAANRTRPHWKHTDGAYLIRRLLEECGELVQAYLENDRELVLQEAADVSNFAAMLADKSW